MSLVTRPDYVYAVFERQCEVAIANLERLHRQVGDAITVFLTTGADFGTQQAPLISPKIYRNLFKPFHIQHQRVDPRQHRLEDVHPFVRLDLAAARRHRRRRASTHSTRCRHPLSTWTRPRSRSATAIASRSGAAASTRSTRCRSERRADVRSMVRERMEVFGRGGGFVFNPIHNVQAGVPIENLLALYDAVNEFRSY